MSDRTHHFSRANSFSSEMAFTLTKRHRQSILSAMSRHSNKSATDTTGVPAKEAPDVVTSEETIVPYELPTKLIKGRKWRNSSFHQLRWIVIFMSGLAVSMMLFLRLNITVAIIKMVNQTALFIQENPGEPPDEIALGYEVETGEFLWDNKIQGFIISSYMIAYTLPQIPLARVAEKTSGFVVMAVSNFVALVVTAVIPYFVYFGWPYAVVLRMILGIAAAPTMAISMLMISKYTPPSETNTALTIVQFSGALGVVCNSLLSGYTADIHWSLAFYSSAFLTFVWLVLWLLVVRDNPEDNWLFSQQEVLYILSSRPHPDQEADDHTDGDGVPEAGVWARVLASKPFYSYLFCWSAYAGVGGAFVFCLPMYLRQVVKLDIKQNGVATFVIQSMALLAYLWASPAITLLQRRMSWTNARRLVYLVGVIVSAITWIVPSYVSGISVYMFMINRVFYQVSDVIIIGSLLCQYSTSGITGTVYSAVNSFGNLACVPITYGIGYLLDIANEDEKCWNWIFAFFAGFNILSLIVFNTTIVSEPPSRDGNGRHSIVSANEDTINSLNKTDSATSKSPTANPKV